MDASKSYLAGRGHTRVHHGHGPRRRHRSQHPLPPPDQASIVVSEDAKWTIEAIKSSGDSKSEVKEEQIILTCNFLFCCAGYYRYSAGHLPEFPNAGRFKGRMIHPQAWPTEASADGKM